MSWTTISAVAMRDARAGFRSRWFIVYAALFLVMIVAFSWVALSASELTGQSGFGRTSAGLLNLLLLLVPLIGLTIGAQAIVSDRQDRSLDYLLSQPVTAVEVYIGKYLGTALTLTLLLLVGFGASGIAIAVRGSSSRIEDFLLLSLLTLLLGLGMLSVGFLISSVSPQTSAALGIAVALWLVFVVLGDLGVMGSSLVMGLRADTLLSITLVNPLDTFKIMSVDLLNASTEVLGPAGIYASDRFGGRLVPILLLIELVWVVIPFVLGGFLFRRMDYR